MFKIFGKTKSWGAIRSFRHTAAFRALRMCLPTRILNYPNGLFDSQRRKSFATLLDFVEATERFRLLNPYFGSEPVVRSRISPQPLAQPVQPQPLLQPQPQPVLQPPPQPVLQPQPQPVLQPQPQPVVQPPPQPVVQPPPQPVLQPQPQPLLQPPPQPVVQPQPQVQPQQPQVPQFNVKPLGPLNPLNPLNPMQPVLPGQPQPQVQPLVAPFAQNPVPNIPVKPLSAQQQQALSQMPPLKLPAPALHPVPPSLNSARDTRQLSLMNLVVDAGGQNPAPADCLPALAPVPNVLDQSGLLPVPKLRMPTPRREEVAPAALKSYREQSQPGLLNMDIVETSEDASTAEKD